MDWIDDRWNFVHGSNMGKFGRISKCSPFHPFKQKRRLDIQMKKNVHPFRKEREVWRENEIKISSIEG